jgi:hypothetical protein
VRRFHACDLRNLAQQRAFGYRRPMKRLLPLAVLAGLGLGATALAAQNGRTDPYTVPEPNVTSGQVLKLPDSAPGCNDTRSVTVRVTPPTGAVLGYVRVVVNGHENARLTGVPRAASATVRVPRSGARLTATASTLGGQRLKSTRVYSDCTRPSSPPEQGGVGVG